MSDFWFGVQFYCLIYLSMAIPMYLYNRLYLFFTLRSIDKAFEPFQKELNDIKNEAKEVERRIDRKEKKL